MKRIFAVTGAVGMLTSAAPAAIAAATLHCAGQVPPGGNTSVCVALNGTQTATALVYHLDNTLNTTTTWFQIYPATKPAGATAMEVVAVPGGVAGVISLPGGLGDTYSHAIGVVCATDPSSTAPTQRGCSYAIWYQMP